MPEEVLHHVELSLAPAPFGDVLAEAGDADHLAVFHDWDALHPRPLAVSPLWVHPILQVDCRPCRELFHGASHRRDVVRVDGIQERARVSLELRNRAAVEALVRGVDEQDFRPVAIEQPQDVGRRPGEFLESLSRLAVVRLGVDSVGDISRAHDVAVQLLVGDVRHPTFEPDPRPVAGPKPVFHDCLGEPVGIGRSFEGPLRLLDVVRVDEFEGVSAGEFGRFPSQQALDRSVDERDGSFVVEQRDDVLRVVEQDGRGSWRAHRSAFTSLA